MNIGLHDADAEHIKGKTYPNYALMKIAAYHKAKKDAVEWWEPLKRYDMVYSSKIFDYTAENLYLPPDTIKGGTGYDIRAKLPQKIDNTYPDYSIYSACDYAVGYITRGCSNRCRWCVVSLSGISDNGTYQEIGVIRNLCLKRTSMNNKPCKCQ